MRKLVFVVSTIVALVIATDRIGGRPIAPGTETHFEVFLDPVEAATWRLQSDKGNLSCCIELAFQCSEPKSLPLEACFSDGTALELLERPIEAGLHVYRIVARTNGVAPARMFDWPATETIKVRFPPGSAGVDVADWRVFLPEEEMDTLARARWRTQWYWISIVALVLSGLTALYAGLSRAEAPTGDPARRCVVEIIEGIEGSDSKKTRRLRTLLRKRCLEGAALRECLDSAGFRGQETRTRAWLEAKDLFLHRYDALIVALQAYRVPLSPPSAR